MAEEYRIAALWIGGDLSFLEQLCLKSFVDAGHHVTLYRYEPVGHVPEGVEMRDAAEILPMGNPLLHERTGSPAVHADLFRYHLMAKCDRTIWADTDAYCVKPFRSNNGHFHGIENPKHRRINNGVLALPQDSATLAALLDFTSDIHSIPPWLPQEERARLEALREAGTPLHAGQMQWGTWGPRALTHFLHATGEARFSFPQEVLYPVPFKERVLMLRPGCDLSGFITDNTVSIHFYGRRMRARLLEKHGGIPKPRSLIGKLLRQHGIEPTLAPIPARHSIAPEAEAEDA